MFCSNNSCWWIIILILLFVFCGNGCGSNCGNECGCGGCGGGRGGGVLLCGDIALRGLGGDGRRRRLGGDEYGARQCHEHGYGYGKEGFMITIGHWKSDE